MSRWHRAKPDRARLPGHPLVKGEKAGHSYDEKNSMLVVFYYVTQSNMQGGYHPTGVISGLFYLAYWVSGGKASTNVGSETREASAYLSEN